MNSTFVQNSPSREYFKGILFPRFLSKKNIPTLVISTIRYLQLRGMKRAFAIPSEFSKKKNKNRRLPCVEIHHKLNQTNFQRGLNLTSELFSSSARGPASILYTPPAVFNLLTRKIYFQGFHSLIKHQSETGK